MEHHDEDPVVTGSGESDNVRDVTEDSDQGVPAELMPLAKAVTKVWTIKSSIVVAVLTLGGMIFDVVVLINGQMNSIPFGVITGAILIVGGLLAYFVPRLQYRFWRYRLHDEELFVQRGIFNRVYTIVPLRRIQHLDVSQDVIEREFDLGKLIVHTAGTRSSDVVLPGLDIAEANRLRDKMKNYILEDAV